LSSLLIAAVLFTPHAFAQSQDDGFLAALGELREASFPDKETFAISWPSSLRTKLATCCCRSDRTLQTG
jgi:hypothetical protein